MEAGALNIGAVLALYLRWLPVGEEQFRASEISGNHRGRHDARLSFVISVGRTADNARQNSYYAYLF